MRKMTLLVILTMIAAVAEENTYDPLALPEGWSAKTIDLNVHDAVRNRNIPIKVYLPATTAPSPVVVFSHGLGGSRDGNPYMGNHWSGRGYICVFLQHPGSDTSVWKDVPRWQRKRAMDQAASGKNFMLRVKDVPAVLDQLAAWNKTDGHPLCGRFDLEHIGMSGHSFGAVTTQAVSGEQFGRWVSFTDPRIDAAVAFSPSVPKRFRDNPAAVFGSVQIPWLLMTGTKDTAIIGDSTAQDRLSVYPALPPGNKYELVLYNAEHSAFSDRALPGDTEPRNLNHHRAILAISTAFWDAYLRNDLNAKTWLDTNGPSSVVESRDRWQKK